MMTKEEILKHYDIQMFNSTIWDVSVPNIVGGGEISVFLGLSWNESRTVNDLLNMIQDYKNGIQLEGGNDLGDSGAYVAVLDGDFVLFVNMQTGTTMQKVPLDHLILIVEIWRDYLKKKGC